MNKKSPVYRTCIVSRSKLLKEELFRVVKTPSGQIYFDIKQNIEGRGVYLKKDLNVIKKAHDKHSLSCYLKTEVPEEIYIALIQALSKEGR